MRLSGFALGLRLALGEMVRVVLPVCFDLYNRRCNVLEVFEEEMQAWGGSMAVSVCGPPGYSEDVRAAVRHGVCHLDVDFFDESFTY